MGKPWKQWETLFSWAPKSQMVSPAMKVKDACSLEEKLWQPRQHIQKQRHHFANKVLYSQSYGFASSHVWMWELDYKESWELKNWCFWTVVLEETSESPLDSKEIWAVNPKGNQSGIFIGRIDAEAETPIFWPPDAKNWLIRKDPDAGKDWRQEEKWVTEDEMVAWHHQLNGDEFEQAPGVGEGQGSLVCCSPWGCRIRHDRVTELNWTPWETALPPQGEKGEYLCHLASLLAQTVKNMLAMWETWVQLLSRKDSLEKGMITHSSILAWRIPGTEEPGGLQSTASQRVRHDWATNTFTFYFLFTYVIMICYFCGFQAKNSEICFKVSSKMP